MTDRTFERRLNDATELVSPFPTASAYIPGEKGGDGVQEEPSYTLSGILERFYEAMGDDFPIATPNERLALTAVVNVLFSEIYARGGVSFWEVSPADRHLLVRKIVVGLPAREFSVETATVESKDFGVDDE